MEHLRSMDITAAKTAPQRAWLPKQATYRLGASDSFTDGFWAGRLWALASVLDLIAPEHREEAAQLLSIQPGELER